MPELYTTNNVPQAAQLAEVLNSMQPNQLVKYFHYYATGHGHELSKKLAFLRGITPPALEKALQLGVTINDSIELAEQGLVLREVVACLSATSATLQETKQALAARFNYITYRDLRLAISHDEAMWLMDCIRWSTRPYKKAYLRLRQVGFNPKTALVLVLEFGYNTIALRRVTTLVKGGIDANDIVDAHTRWSSTIFWQYVDLARLAIAANVTLTCNEALEVMDRTSPPYTRYLRLRQEMNHCTAMAAW